MYNRILRSDITTLMDSDTSFSVDINSALKSLKGSVTHIYKRKKCH